MLGLGRAIGAVGVALGFGAGAVFGVPHAREAGLLPSVEAQERLTEPAADDGFDDAPPTPLSIHRDRYVSGDNLISSVNTLCGFPDTLVPGQSYLHIDTEGQEAALSIFEVSETLSYERRSASASTLYAYEEFDELVLQTNGPNFSSRVHVVEPDGEYGFSGPLEHKPYRRLECADASAAAHALNAVFEANDADINPVRGNVRSFAVTSIWEEGDSLTDFLAVCRSPTDYAALDGAGPFLIDARYQADGTYGDSIYHDMSGEYRGGTPVALLNVTIAEGVSDDSAVVYNYAAPVEWSFLPETPNGFGPYYRFAAVQAYAFNIEPDGSQSHSVDMGGVDGVDIPCADVDAGRAILDALRDGSYVAPRDRERG